MSTTSNINPASFKCPHCTAMCGFRKGFIILLEAPKKALPKVTIQKRLKDIWDKAMHALGVITFWVVVLIMLYFAVFQDFLKTCGINIF